MGITGIRTHLIDLDKMINGFNNSNLMILAARPAMGKTALALNIAENICFKDNISRGHIFFGDERRTARPSPHLFTSRGGIGQNQERVFKWGHEFQRIVACGERDDKYHVMIIDDQPGSKSRTCAPGRGA